MFFSSTDKLQSASRSLTSRPVIAQLECRRELAEEMVKNFSTLRYSVLGVFTDQQQTIDDPQVVDIGPHFLFLFASIQLGSRVQASVTNWDELE